MIVGPDSILRRIPFGMERRQALFLEGIRFSVEMADFAHNRLLETLPELSREDVFDRTTEPAVSAMLDAWSIVDSLHRLRALLERMPGLAKRSQTPSFRGFFAATETVSALRNTVQHLDSEIPKIVDDQNWAVLGSLHWGVVNEDSDEITSSTFMPGVPLGSRPMINPASRPVWHIPVDAVTLERSSVSVCISDAMRRLQTLVQGLEEALETAYAGQLPNHGSHGADLTVSIVFHVSPDTIRPR